MASSTSVSAISPNFATRTISPVDRKRLVEGDRATRHAPREVLSRDQLHHQQETALELLEAVDVRDVGVIQGGERPGFALEARTSRRIRSQRIGQNLDRDVATKPGIVSAIHLTHPARAERADDFVRTETVSDPEAHGTCGEFEL